MSCADFNSYSDMWTLNEEGVFMCLLNSIKLRQFMIWNNVIYLSLLCVRLKPKFTLS